MSSNFQDTLVLSARESAGGADIPVSGVKGRQQGDVMAGAEVQVGSLSGALPPLHAI